MKLIENFLAFERLHIHINGATHYPYVLAYHDITGNANARLVIGNKGCDWKLTRIWASERHIRVYALNVLKKVCSLQDVTRMGVSQPINVDIAFSFRHTEESNPKDYSELRGNVIVVQRWYSKSVLDWNLGPFKGKFPIPAVNIDFTWLMENWNQYVNHKGPFHEFDRTYRDGG